MVDQNVLPINQRFQQNEKHSRFNQGPQPLMVRFRDISLSNNTCKKLLILQSQPPPSIEHTQQNEQSDQQTEEVFDEHQQPRNPHSQPKEQNSRFQKGPQPSMVGYSWAAISHQKSNI